MMQLIEVNKTKHRVLKAILALVHFMQQLYAKSVKHQFSVVNDNAIFVD